MLPATSDLFAYFDDLSFAASPFMPLIFTYDGTRYVEATRSFPDVVNAALEQAEADLADATSRPSALAYQESVVLRLYGLHWLLGDLDAALPAIKARVAAPVARWLEENAAPPPMPSSNATRSQHEAVTRSGSGEHCAPCERRALTQLRFGGAPRAPRRQSLLRTRARCALLSAATSRLGPGSRA